MAAASSHKVTPDPVAKTEENCLEAVLPGSSSTGGTKELNNNNNEWCCAKAFFASRQTKDRVVLDFSPNVSSRRLPISPIYQRKHDTGRLKLDINNNDGPKRLSPTPSSPNNGISSLKISVAEKVPSGFLFPPGKLTSIEWSEAKNVFPAGICPTNAGEGLKLRPLHIKDYGRGYLELLGQLTTVGQVSKQLFEETFQELKAGHSQYIAVIEDESREKIIGSATLVLERKFIHSAGMRGRIEDVVVNNEYRGKQLGKLLVESLTLLGKELGCYKVSLECKDKLIPFYESFGFQVDAGNNFLVQRFKD